MNTLSPTLRSFHHFYGGGERRRGAFPLLQGLWGYPLHLLIMGQNRNFPEGNVGSFLNQGGIRRRRKADYALFVKKREGTKVVSSILQHYQ